MAAHVGNGDSHDPGAAARAVVTVQELFNLAVLAAGAAVLVHSLARRRDRTAGGAARPRRPD